MKLIDIHHVSYDSLAIQPETICRFLGYSKAIPGQDIMQLIQHYLDEATEVCRPLFGYRIVQGNVTDKYMLELEDVSFNPGPVISKFLAGCDQYIILTATVGEVGNDWLHRIKDEGDMLHTFITDAIGSSVADATAQYAEKYLAGQVLKDGLRTTNSYSPGYCDWNVNEQQLLFSLLPAGFCGITLNNSSLMNPIKSISSVIGLGEDAERKPYSCAICKRKDCFLRKANV